MRALQLCDELCASSSDTPPDVARRAADLRARIHARHALSHSLFSIVNIRF
jgi:hypothetical protein